MHFAFGWFLMDFNPNSTSPRSLSFILRHICYCARILARAVALCPIYCYYTRGYLTARHPLLRLLEMNPLS